MRYFVRVALTIVIFGFGNFTIFLNKQAFAKSPIQKLSPEDSTLFARYKHKVAAYINPKPDSALFYIRLIKNFSKERNYGLGIADAYYLQAMYFRRFQKTDTAILYFNKSLETSEKYGYRRGIAVAYNGLCLTFYTHGRVEAAVDACRKCLEMARPLRDTMVVADTHLAFGNIYLRENDLKNSLFHFLKVDSIASVANLRPDIVAAAYQGLGSVYLSLKEYNKAEDYFLRADKQFRNMPFEPSYYLYTTQWHLGEISFHKKQYGRADSLLAGSYDFFKQIGDLKTVADISVVRGLVCAGKQKWPEAEKYLKEGYNLAKSHANAHETSLAALQLGSFYLDRNKPNLAIGFLNEAIEGWSDKNHTNTRQEALIKLAKAYAIAGDHRKAFSPLRKGMNLKDSLVSVQSAEKIRELEEIYQHEKAQHQITMLKSKNKLSEQQKQNQFNLLLATIAVLSITGLYLLFLYRNRKKTAEKLEQLDKAKTNFFTNISHEFRTPLTLISGHLQRLMKRETISEEEQADLKNINRNVKRLLSLVNKLLDISKIEAGKMEVVKTKNNILHFVTTVIESFRFLAEQKKLAFEVRIDVCDCDYWFDKTILEKIIMNLLSNAIKYTPDGGGIYCDARVSNDVFYFDVRNTGRGLRSEEMKNVFKRFYRAGNDKNGSGIGLALVKELITLYNGNIKVESVGGKWTLFGIELPLTDTAGAGAKTVLTKKSAGRKNKRLSPVSNDCIGRSGKDDQPIMLIAEDNEDVLKYISSVFEKDYKIHKARNGLEGLALALEHIPDIVISDIMMPEKDGLEMCRQLRENEKTSHIPIIFLTARAGDENIMEGLRTGADDFIIKPFNEELLKLKVQKLIEHREALRKSFRKEIVLKPSGKSIAPADNLFVSRLQKVMDERVTDPGFTAEEFSRAMGMSRMQLHRKLKTITGLSTTEFIRSQRLRLAADLLKNLKDSDTNISEIGYKVGFNDITYFIKCFKKQYSHTPKEYALQYAESSK